MPSNAKKVDVKFRNTNWNFPACLGQDFYTAVNFKVRIYVPELSLYVRRDMTVSVPFSGLLKQMKFLLMANTTSKCETAQQHALGYLYNPSFIISKHDCYQYCVGSGRVHFHAHVHIALSYLMAPTMSSTNT